jgi:hypothetical protein
MHRFHTAFFLVLISSAVAFSGCRDAAKESKKDVPRLTANVRMQDVSFHSSALQREMSYRVVLPKTINGNKLPVVYLLHGGGGGFRDWSNYSDVAHYAERGLILVMPEGGSSYYTNSLHARKSVSKTTSSMTLLPMSKPDFLQPPTARGARSSERRWVGLEQSRLLSNVLTSSCSRAGLALLSMSPHARSQSNA